LSSTNKITQSQKYDVTFEDEETHTTVTI